METLESLRRRIESAESLLSVVKTMKTMAAASIRQYERAVNALTAYNQTIEMSLQVTLRHRPLALEEEPERGAAPDDDGQAGAVVFGSDQGLCGRFNERVADYTVNTLNGMHIARHDRSLLTVGRRVTSRLESAHQPIEDAFMMPSSIEGIGSAVQLLLVRIEAWRNQQSINRVLLFYNRTNSETSYAPHMVQIVPLDLEWLAQLAETPWPTQNLPAIFMEWQPLFRSLVRQYLFVALYRAFAESLASENAGRLASMQAAERNIEEYLNEFQAAYQQQRQNTITSELLDIVGGYEALTQK